MARFSFSSADMFQYAKNVRTKINNMYNDVKDWVDNSLSAVDSMGARSVESRHLAEPVTFLIGDYQRDALGTTPEVFYTLSGTKPKAFCLGWFWGRRTDGAYTDPISVAGKLLIDWYDANAAAYANSFNGSNYGWGRQFGTDATVTTPLPVYTSPVFNFGGAPAQVVTAVFGDGDEDDWPPVAPADPVRFGLRSTATFLAPFTAQGELWVFLEDTP